MSESTTVTTGLTSQYIAQVAGDLESNLKEQERISAEIGALQQQLTALQQDHSVLVNMQQALGITGSPVAPAATPESVTVPSPQRAPAPALAASRGQRRPQPHRQTRRPRRPRPRRPPRRRPGPPWWNSSAATSPSRANHAPLRKFPPRSARPIPNATSRPRSYGSPSKGSWPRVRLNGTSRVPPSTTPPPRRRNRPLCPVPRNSPKTRTAEARGSNHTDRPLRMKHPAGAGDKRPASVTIIALRLTTGCVRVAGSHRCD